METTSLKVRVATFAAGALSVAMIPAGLANDDIGAMLGLKNDVQTHVEADGSDGDGSVTLHQQSDVSGSVHADHDNHGADVSAIARQKTDFDGEFDTHGGHVSAVARQKTDIETHANARAGDLEDAYVDAHAAVHANGNLSADADDESVDVHGTANADASADVDVSSNDEHDEDGLLDVGSDDGDEDSNHDEDGSSSDLLDDLDLDLL
jgi:hypothetical protein